MSNNFSFEDAFRRIVQDNADLRSGKIDTATATALHAGHLTLDKFLNTALKHHQIGLMTGKPIPTLGGTLIFNGQVDETPAIEGEKISQESLQQAASVPVSAPAVPKTRKPRIGIVGLSPNQAGNISAAFGEYLDLQFWKDEGVEKLRNMANCDQVFVNVSQVSHQSTGILDSVGAKYKTTGSGVTSMKEAIKRYCEA